MVKENHKKIITVVLSIIIVFYSFRTFYYVFLAKDETKEVMKEELNLEQEYNLSNDLLQNIIYIPGYNGVYNLNNQNIENIDSFLLNFFLFYHIKESIKQDNPPDEFLIFKEEYCTDNDNCFFVSKEYLEFQANLLFKKDSITFEELDESSNCKYTDSHMLCYFKNNAEFIKKSIVEGYKEEEEYFHVYERALFVSDVVITPTSDMYVIKIDKLRNTSDYNEEDNIIGENIELTSAKEEYSDILIAKFNSNSYLYKHTFKKTSTNEMLWTETKIVNSLNN